MGEELQNLLDRIQKDGVARAQAESDRILEAARKKADAVRTEADNKAKALIEQAERDAATFAKRGEQALQQAARDVILSVGQALSGMLQDIVRREVTSALTIDTLKEMLVKTVEAYCKAGGASIDVILNEKQKDDVAAFLARKFADELGKGMEIRGDGTVVSGFRVSLDGGKVEHDFSDEAIAEALSRLVRPHLAEIVKDAAKQAGSKGGK